MVFVFMLVSPSFYSAVLKLNDTKTPKYVHNGVNYSTNHTSELACDPHSGESRSFCRLLNNQFQRKEG